MSKHTPLPFFTGDMENMPLFINDGELFSAKLDGVSFTNKRGSVPRVWIAISIHNDAVKKNIIYLCEMLGLYISDEINEGVAPQQGGSSKKGAAASKKAAPARAHSVKKEVGSPRADVGAPAQVHGDNVRKPKCSDFDSTDSEEDEEAQIHIAADEPATLATLRQVNRHIQRHPQARKSEIGVANFILADESDDRGE